MSTQFVAENGQPSAILTREHSDPEPTNKRKSFQERVHEFEREVLAEALSEASGSVTRAARALGLTHQGLCYIINHRHKDLLTARTPIRIRHRSIITKDKLRRRRRSK
jgi:transcriptional regulator with GAF, ATPase, and Fis domain